MAQKTFKVILLFFFYLPNQLWKEVELEKVSTMLISPVPYLVSIARWKKSCGAKSDCFFIFSNFCFKLFLISSFLKMLQKVQNYWIDFWNSHLNSLILFVNLIRNVYFTKGLSIPENHKYVNFFFKNLKIRGDQPIIGLMFAYFLNCRGTIIEWKVDFTFANLKSWLFNFYIPGVS